MELYAHQLVTADFMESHPRFFNTSDPGTGKTAATLEGYRRTKTGKCLVLAPLSILTPSWGEDISRFTDFSYMIAHGSAAKREKAMRANCDVVVTNHDAVNWIIKDLSLLDGFDQLIIDEFPAFKNPQSQRSKAVRKLTDAIEKVCMLSGTPNSRSILDLWYPSFLLDKGQRLGRKFWAFRSQVCEPVQVSPNAMHVSWVDKPGIELEVGDLVKDITLRFRFEDCVDIPANTVRTMELQMPPFIRTAYENFLHDSYLETEGGVLTAIHAGARVRKGLQILSGAVYDGSGEVLRIHDERYQLVMELVQQRKQSLVAFNFTHERQALVRIAEANGVRYGVIDSSASVSQRNKIVVDFQAGELDVIFAHPQSAAHGLTLTAGTATIWCSPTYNAEHYQQFNKRIYRAGQTERTETIRIAYAGSKEIEVYEKLDDKMLRMESLLEFFQINSQAA